MNALKRPQIARIALIDQFLRERRFPNTVTLANTLEVSEKTIRRDLALIRDVHRAPLEYDRHKRGFYYAQPTYRLPAMQLSEGELLGLLVGSQVLKEYHAKPFGATLANLFQN